MGKGEGGREGGRERERENATGHYFKFQWNLTDIGGL